MTIISTLSSATLAQLPQWCNAGYNVQAAPGYSQCSTHTVANLNDNLYQRASWCEKTNFYSSIPISFMDPELNNNCSNPYSHCIPGPNNLQLNIPSCETDPLPKVVHFYPATNINKTNPVNINDYHKKCTVTGFAEPVEIVANGNNNELLFITTQQGIGIVDMSQEKYVYEQIMPQQSFQFLKQVPPDTSVSAAYIFAAQGNTLFLWSMNYNGANLAVKQQTSTIPTTYGQILGLTAFIERDGTNNRWAAVLVGPNPTSPTAILFYLMNNGILSASPAMKWNLATSSSVTIDSFECKIF